MTYATNKYYFSIPNMENSYWAGFLAADGCLWKRGDAVEIGLQERVSGKRAKQMRALLSCIEVPKMERKWYKEFSYV